MKSAPEGVDRGAFEAAKTPAGLNIERQNYARTWSEGDAAAFDLAGLYAWMATRVQGHQRVLEIGTGDGRGTLELLRAGHDVVSIDENPACLELAHARLSSAGVDATMLLRGTVHQADDGYLLKYKSIELPSSTGRALLIEGDTLTDSRLMGWLKAQGGFDAIACWLLGSHRARQLNVKLPLNLERGLLTSA